MTLARRQIMTLAVFGAVTAGGGAAIAEANNSGSQPTQNPSQPAADAVAARSAALRDQVAVLVHEDRTLHAALHDARRHLALRVRHNERVLARQRASIARTTAAAMAAPAPPASVASAPQPALAAPAPTAAAPKPSPTASHHGTTGASGAGSGHGSGDDGGHDD